MESITYKQQVTLQAVGKRDASGQRGLWTVQEIFENCDRAVAAWCRPMYNSTDAARSSLRRLEMRGYVRDVSKRVDGVTRKHYQLTREGRNILKQYGLA